MGKVLSAGQREETRSEGSATVSGTGGKIYTASGDFREMGQVVLGYPAA